MLPTSFLERIKIIRNQTAAILQEIEGEDVEQYKVALEDMLDGLTSAIDEYQSDEDPLPHVQGGRRKKSKARKTRRRR